MKLEEVNKRTKEAVDFLVAALESGHSEVLTAYLSEQWRSFTPTASYVIEHIGSFMSSAGLCELALACLLPVPMNTP
jgi:hypothetical protein